MIHNKFWQGFFAITPMASFVLITIGYLVFLFSIFNNLPELENNDVPPMEFFGGLGFLIFMVFLVVIISFASLVFYIVHAVQNPNLKDNNMLIVWILLFIFISGIGQFVYWLVEIVSKGTKSTA
ncbi:hypothetical protein FGF1_01750 [Flavobacteriaceae bacterium GF1]